MRIISGIIKLGVIININSIHWYLVYKKGICADTRHDIREYM